MYLTSLKVSGREVAITDKIRNEVRSAVLRMHPPESQGANLSPSFSNFMPTDYSQNVPPPVSPGVHTGVSYHQPQARANYGFSNILSSQSNTTFVQESTTWAVTPEEKYTHDQVFRAWDAHGTGFISGAQAREIFSQSGLPQAALMQIW